MKNNRRFLCVIILSLFMANLIKTNVIASTFEEDNVDDELININEGYADDVNINNILTEKFRVSARNAIAIDGSTKQVLFDQNSNEVVAMASTTKIITALIAINQGELDKVFTISKNAAGIRGSTVGYAAGEKVKLRELLFGLMFKSGNDAAIAIAEGIGGSVDNFAKLMNDYARGLGLTNSHFESPHGLDSPKHYSSAYDLAILTAKAMENDLFREICGEKSMQRSKYNFSRDYQNINKILYKIPNANGVKTGYTGQAGKCLVSSVKHEGRNIIIVVLNCTDRWNQTEKIFRYIETKYAFQNKGSIEIVESAQITNLGSIIEEKEFQYGFKEDTEVEVEVFKPIDDIEKGSILGKIFIKENGNEKIKDSIISNRNLNKETFERLILNNAEGNS